MNLEQLANKDVVVLTDSDPVDLAIQTMWRLNVRHLPVVKEGVVVGIVSDRDVLFHVCWLDQEESRLAGDRADPVVGKSRIDRIMTSPAIVLSPNDPIELGARVLLNERISCAPLAAKDHIVGIVTESDYLKCYNDDGFLVPGPACRQASVRDHLTARVFSVQPSDATLTAIQLMRDKHIRHVAVLDAGSLVGILSDRDVLRGSPRQVSDHALSAEDLRVPHEAEVSGIMSACPVVLPISATLAEAAKTMVDDRIGALPVVDDNTLVGIITETDLLRALAADCER